MTKLLKKAFDEASKLPEKEQDALARLLLEELASEPFERNVLKEMCPHRSLNERLTLARSAAQFLRWLNRFVRVYAAIAKEAGHSPHESRSRTR